MKKKSSYVRKIARTILCFFAAVFLVCFAVLLVLRLTLFSPVQMERSAETVDYAQRMSKEINQQLVATIRGGNVSERALENLPIENLVKEDVQTFIQAAYQNPNGESAFEATGGKEVQSIVRSRLDEYMLEQTHLTATPEQLNELSVESASIYERMIKLPFFFDFTRRIIGFKTSTPEQLNE
jgi:hypothetical protein